MGISGLLPFLKKIHTPVNIAQFQGCTVAIDAYCWLHKGAFSCADRLALGENTEQYVNYCMKYVDYILKNGLKPILVFDGCHLPSKKDVEKTRREKREVHKKRAAQLLREGKRAEAKECLQRSVDITPQMAHKLITSCRQRGVDCLVAPYEADSQLAYLAKTGIAQLVITEDSDLLLFGCSRVIFKMDYNGNGIMIEQSRLNEVTDIQNGFYTFERFRHMCILSGCDYLPSLPNIGLAKACKVFKTTRQQDIRQVLRKLPTYIKLSSQVTEDYIEKFVRADNTFLYQLCFDPLQRKLVPLNPYPPEVNPAELTYAGPPMPNHVALQIALGNIDLYTREQVDSFDPDKSQNRTGRNGKGQNQLSSAHHQSIWRCGFRQQGQVLEVLQMQDKEEATRPACQQPGISPALLKISPRKHVRPAEKCAEVCSNAELASMYAGLDQPKEHCRGPQLPSLCPTQMPQLQQPGPQLGKLESEGDENKPSPRKRNKFVVSTSQAKKRRFDVNKFKEVRSRYFMDFSHAVPQLEPAGGVEGANASMEEPQAEECLPLQDSPEFQGVKDIHMANKVSFLDTFMRTSVKSKLDFDANGTTAQASGDVQNLSSKSTSPGGTKTVVRETCPDIGRSVGKCIYGDLHGKSVHGKQKSVQTNEEFSFGRHPSSGTRVARPAFQWSRFAYSRSDGLGKANSFSFGDRSTHQLQREQSSERAGSKTANRGESESASVTNDGSFEYVSGHVSCGPEPCGAAGADVTAIPSIEWTHFLKMTDDRKNGSADIEKSFLSDYQRKPSKKTEHHATDVEISISAGTRENSGLSVLTRAECFDQQSSRQLTPQWLESDLEQQSAGQRSASQQWVSQSSGSQQSNPCRLDCRGSLSTQDTVDLTQEMEETSPSSQASSEKSFAFTKMNSTPNASASGKQGVRKISRVPGLSRWRKSKSLPDERQQSIKDMLSRFSRDGR